jgi:hypothetical protein
MASFYSQVDRGFVACLDHDRNEFGDLCRLLSIDMQDVSASLLSDVPLELQELGSANERTNQSLFNPFGSSVELSHNIVTNKYVCRVQVDPIKLRTSLSDIVAIHQFARLAALLKENLTVLDHSGRKYLTYRVVFHSEKLGLGLRLQQSKVVVENLNGYPKNDIKQGDYIYALNENIVFEKPDETIASIVDRLNLMKRPIIVTFCRHLIEGKERKTSVVSLTDIQADLVLTGASLVVMESDMPLIGCHLTRSNFHGSMDILETGQHACFDASATLALDYYNLRVWRWEPWLEPCHFFCAASYHHGDLAIEIGDRGGSFDFVFSDAWFEAMYRGTQQLDSNVNLFDTQFFDFGGDEEQKLEQFAKSFAEKQTKGSVRQFIFRNRSGISLAFARSLRIQDMCRRPQSDLCAVGGYLGMGIYDSSEVSIVRSGEDLPFSLQLEDSSSMLWSGPNGRSSGNQWSFNSSF